MHSVFHCRQDVWIVPGTVAFPAPGGQPLTSFIQPVRSQLPVIFVSWYYFRWRTFICQTAISLMTSSWTCQTQAWNVDNFCSYQNRTIYIFILWRVSLKSPCLSVRPSVHPSLKRQFCPCISTQTAAHCMIRLTGHVPYHLKECIIQGLYASWKS